MTSTSLIQTLSKLAAAAFVAAAIGSTANAQNVTASDNASATNYPGGTWNTSTNGGTGFGAWSLPGSAGTGGFNGNFIGSTTISNYTALYSGGVAFSMYAGGDAGAFQDALRPFSAAMSTGQVLSFSVGFSFDNGNKGFDLYSNTNGTGQVFNFNIGTSYSWTGGGSANMTTWGGARENGVVINFSFTKTASGFSYTINSSQDSGLTQSGNITASGLGSLKFYISGAGGGDGGNLYFNNLQILGDPAPPAIPTITSSSTANGTAGTPFFYQTTVTPELPTTYNATGLPGGLTMNSTTGLISGIPSSSGNATVTIQAINSEGTSDPFVLDISISLPEAPSIWSSWGAITVPEYSFSYQIETSPSGVPTTYNATGLPNGLTLDSATGLISGNTTSTGISTVTLSASNEAGSSEPFLLYIVSASSADLASNYQALGWTDGSNQSLGTGFGNWTFTTNNGTGGAAGVFLGDPFAAGILDMSNPSFGLYANPTDSGASISVKRNLTTPLGVGETLAFQWGINYDAGNVTGNKGFTLYVGSDPAIKVENGGNSSITLNGNDIGMPYGVYGVSIELIQISNTTVKVTASSRDGSGTIYSTDITTNGPISGLEFFASGLDTSLGSEREPYFNSLIIMPPAAPTIISWPYESATVGSEFIYETIVSPNLPTTYNATGLPDGLSMNSTTGVISGTPTSAGNSTVTIVAVNDYGTSANFTLSVSVVLPDAPVITSPWTAVTALGQPLAYQTSVYPSDVITTFEATNLPDGLAIDLNTGLISGTANSTGYFAANITATNAGGSGSSTILISVGKAADTALNYNEAGWTDGSNLSIGTGFGNWSFTSVNGTGAAGPFLGNPADAGILELPSVSFGLYANPGDSGAFVDARRDLSNPLTEGEALAFEWGMNFDSNTTNGSKGFTVFAGSEEIVNVFNGNTGNITVNGVDTGFTYGTYAMFWEFYQLSNNSVNVYGTPRDPTGEVFNVTFTTNGTISAVKFYASGLSDDEFKDRRQPYFNNFVIMPASGPSPNPYNDWAYSYSLDPEATTGPTAGAPEADPDSDSFTNQQEYAFGTDPVQATAGLMTTSSTGGNLTVTFLTRTELSYVVQTTNNLSTTPFADNFDITISDGPELPTPPSGYIRKQFTITPSGGKNFYRVIATEQTPG